LLGRNVVQRKKKKKKTYHMTESGRDDVSREKPRWVAKGRGYGKIVGRLKDGGGQKRCKQKHSPPNASASHGEGEGGCKGE